jgi:hypothetical protein
MSELIYQGIFCSMQNDKETPHFDDPVQAPDRFIRDIDSKQAVQMINCLLRFQGRAFHGITVDKASNSGPAIPFSCEAYKAS